MNVDRDPRVDPKPGDELLIPGRARYIVRFSGKWVKVYRFGILTLSDGRVVELEEAAWDTYGIRVWRRKMLEAQVIRRGMS